eukprot:5006903-Pleurochrysis_carterae.AAC.1
MAAGEMRKLGRRRRRPRCRTFDCDGDAGALAYWIAVPESLRAAKESADAAREGVVPAGLTPASGR